MITADWQETALHIREFACFNIQHLAPLDPGRRSVGMATCRGASLATDAAAQIHNHYVTCHAITLSLYFAERGASQGLYLLRCLGCNLGAQLFNLYDKAAMFATTDFFRAVTSDQGKIHFASFHGRYRNSNVNRHA